MKPSVHRIVDLGDGTSTHLTGWGEAGPVLVGIHGITSSRMTWVRFAQHFAASYRVFAYDQRGHGDSATIAGPMTLERSLRDLEAVMTAIGEPARALIGHSWGGAVAILGGRRVDCERVVAIDPMIHQAPGTWYADFVDELRVVLATPSKERERVVREHYSALPPIEIDGKVHAMRSMTIEPIVALGDENRVDEGKWDLRPQLVDYPKPLLLAVADPEESIVAGEDLVFVRLRGGPNVRVEIFAGEGHSLQRTAFEKFAALVEAFLPPQRP